MESHDALIDETLHAIDNAETLADRLKRQTRRVFAHVLDDIGVRYTTEISAGPAAVLAPKLAEAITTNDYKAGMGALDDFIANIRSSLVNERSMGRLKVVTKFDKVAAWKDELSRSHWAAPEKSTIIDNEALMAPDDDFAAVTLDVIILVSGKTITRDAVSAYCRYEIAGSLITEEKLREIREAQAAPPKKSSNTGYVDKAGHYTEFGG